MSAARSERASSRSSRPISLLLTHDDIPADAVEFVVAAADQRGVSAVIVQCCAPPAESDDVATVRWETARQEVLDTELAPWHDKFPHLGIIVELRTEPVDDVIDLLQRTSQLLIVA